LTHTALRYWRFPDDRDPTEVKTNFAKFLRPFALEAGLTDQAIIDTALGRVVELLTRFQAHPLYTQLSAAERHHEVPYSVTLAGEMHSGIIDLLFRSSPKASWTIAEFKTDRLAEDVDLRQHTQQNGYDRQVEAYRQAVAQQLGTTPQVLLVFLNVGRSIRSISL
jgi:ATP-dependent exoDNAse (exonuclease V) beta subunit